MRNEEKVVSQDELSLVNCAGCGVELLGERCEKHIRLSHGEEALKKLPGLVALRSNGRPYCRSCVKTKMVNGRMPS